MNATYMKVKEYNGPYKRVVMVDGKPVAIVRSDRRAAQLVLYLEGESVEIADGKIKQILDNLKDHSIEAWRKKTDELLASMNMTALTDTERKNYNAAIKKKATPTGIKLNK